MIKITTSTTSQIMLEDLFHMISDADNPIGEGVHRRVYDLPSWLNTETPLVLKLSKDVIHNATEYDVFCRVRYMSIAKWFAPVVAISGGGRWLVQHKTTPINHDEYPDKIPAFFTDTKYSNFGMLGDQFVCHDYALNLLMENGMGKRMRKADWWDG